MSWVKEADRELTRVFEFVVWGFKQLGYAAAWAWNQTPDHWEWWWRALLLLGVLLLGPRLVGMVVRRLWDWIKGIPATFGQARFASLRELARAGMLKPGGRFLGRFKGRELFVHGEGHCLTIAAQGSGKTTGLIIPTLITYRGGSVVVTDPKGAITAQTRRLREGAGRVVVLNPWREELADDPAFKLDLGDDGFNPLQLVSMNPEGRLGQRTVRTENRSATGETSTGLAGVPLIRPEELSGMKRGRQIIIRPEGRPVYGRVVPFFAKKEWRDAVDRNPYRGG